MFQFVLLVTSLCFSSFAMASDDSLLDLSYVNHPGQFSVSVASINSKSGLSGTVSSVSVNTHSDQSLFGFEAKIGIFKDFAFSVGRATGTSKTKSSIDNGAEDKVSSIGEADPFLGISWRILGSGGDDGAGLLLEAAYSPDTSSNKYGRTAVTGKNGDLKRGGTASGVKLSLYKKFSVYEVMLKLGATMNGAATKKNADDSATYKYEASTNTRYELINRWNIAEAFYFDLIYALENNGAVESKNETTSTVTKVGEYSQGSVGLGLGFNFFETVVLDLRAELDQLQQPVQIQSGSTTTDWRTNSGSVATVGLSAYF